MLYTSTTFQVREKKALALLATANSTPLLSLAQNVRMSNGGFLVVGPEGGEFSLVHIPVFFSLVTS